MKKSVGVLLLFSGMAAGAVTMWKWKEKDILRFKEYADKHLAIMLLYNQWLRTKQEGKSIVKYFENHGYRKIAIYGMSYVGQRLLDELKASGIEVKYAIDKNADDLYAEVEIIVPEDDFDEVDAIVVTSNYYYDVIEQNLKKKTKYPILSLVDILSDI